MILTNYYKWLNDVKRYNAIESDIYNLQDLTDYGGNTSTWVISGNNSVGGTGISSYNRNMGSGISVKFSSSENTPSKDRYNMGNEVTSSFNVSVQTTFSTEGGDSVQVFTITGTNTSSQTKTIRQIGICKGLKTIGGVESAFLFAIHVLETPITVAAGESFTKVIKWIDE